jgi:hypothetical protein
MKKLNKIIFLTAIYSLSIYGGYRAITETYKLSCEFVKAKKALTIDEVAEIEGINQEVNPQLIKTVIRYENRKGKDWKLRNLSEIPTDNISNAGAIGLMQVMPKNAKFCGLKPQDLFIPAKNIYCGTKLLKDNLVRQKNATTAIAEYNGGKNGNNKSTETIDYKREVLLAFAESTEK